MAAHLDHRAHPGLLASLGLRDRWAHLDLPDLLQDFPGLPGLLPDDLVGPVAPVDDLMVAENRADESPAAEAGNQVAGDMAADDKIREVADNTVDGRALVRPRKLTRCGQNKRPRKTNHSDNTKKCRAHKQEGHNRDNKHIRAAGSKRKQDYKPAHRLFPDWLVESPLPCWSHRRPDPRIRVRRLHW
jgi:hypothetical protein